MIKLFMLALLIPISVLAEPFSVTYTEPALQGGQLAKTCIYWCACRNSSSCNCIDWQQAMCVNSDDGIGGDTHTDVTFNIPLRFDDLPVTVRYAVTSINDTGNESAKVIGSPNHTFPAP